MLDFKPSRKLILLLKLIKFENAEKNPKSLLEYEKFVGFNLPQQDTRSVLKLLINCKVLIEKDIVYGTHRYILNMNQLEAFIENTEIGKLFYDYFNEIYNIKI